MDQNVSASVMSVTLSMVEVLIMAIWLLYKDCGAYRIDMTSLRVSSLKLQSKTFSHLHLVVLIHADSFGFMSPEFDICVCRISACA